MALENKDKIKDLFSSKLQSFEPEVPASLWAGIDQSLSQQPLPTEVSSASHSIWLKVAGTVAVAALIIAAIFLLNDESEEVEDTLQEQVIPASDTISIPVDTFIPEIVKEPVFISNHPKGYWVDTPEYRVIIKEPKPIAETVEIIENKLATDTVSLIFEEEEEEFIEPVRKQKEAISLGIFGGYGLSTEEITQQGGILSFRDDQILSEDLEYGKNNFKLEHDRPISFGLILNKELTSRISVETGLVYTYLSSTITSNDNFRLRERQKFHYIGIPLSANYTFIKCKKLNAYISVGGIIQKDFSGTYTGTLDGYVYGKENELLVATERLKNSKRSINQKNPQFSTHFNLGISYPVYRRLYIYGVFGGVYYFDASNRYRTIYSDKDLQWNLNLGLKWKF